MTSHPAAATPVYFGPPAQPLLGWYHAGRAGAGLAVLVCGPWGDEDLGTYSGLRSLGGEMAAAGLPVLRFDWAGEGDSFEPDTAAGGDRWPQWLASAHAALDELRRLSGAQRLAIVGVRLGALLAAHAAAGRADVAALVGLLPPATGKAWLREARLAGAAAGAEQAAEGQVAAGGFLLNAATAAQVGALRWPAPDAGPALPQACMLTRADLPPPASALAAWQAMAGELVHEPREDLGALLAVAHSACWPRPLLAHVAAWLGRQAAAQALPEPGETVVVSGVPSGSAFGHSPLEQPGEPMPPKVLAQGIEESVVVVGAAAGEVHAAPVEGQLAGVLSRPAQGAAPGAPLLLLLSSGAERRIGPHRLWVTLARQRAQRGEVVLRLDLPGLGDSPPRPGEPGTDLYDERCAQDVARAVAWLQREHGPGPVTVMGICSGAYHAWRAALDGLPAQAVVAINPLVFHWRPGMSLDPLALDFGQIAISEEALRSARDPARWLKLLRGQVNVGVILRALAGRCMASLRGAGLAGLRALGFRLGHDLGRELQRASSAGRVLHFVFAAGDPGQALLERDGGSRLARLCQAQRVHLHQVAGADHTFMGQAGRQRLYQHLHALLDEPYRRAHPARSVTRSLSLP